jgi:hypothetical protein
VDSAHGQVFVTGGYGTNSIAVVKTDGSEVTMIEGTPGATAMSMTEDGRFVYVTLRNGDGIAEVDTSTLAMRRLDTGANSCPTQVAARAGYVWFVASGSDCNQWTSIERLNPRTGDVTGPLTGSLYQPVLRVIPGTTRFMYAETGISTSDVGVYDVASGTLNRTASISLESYLTSGIRPTNDGGHLMVGRNQSVAYYRISDFSADGTTSVPGGWPVAWAADDQVVVAALSDSNRIEVLRRGDGSRLNSIVLGSTGSGDDVKGLELVGDQVFAITLGGTLRLYQVDRPTVAPPNLTVEAPAQSALGSPVTVSGVLSDQGAPIAGAVITVRQDGVEQPLGSPTTDADGRYSLEFTPADTGTLGISAQYAGTEAVKPQSGHVVVKVVRRPVALTLAGPASVWPGEEISLNGSLFDGNQALAGVSVRVDRRCEGSSPGDVETVLTDSSGSFTTKSTPGRCAYYDFVATYDGDDQRAPASKIATVDVNWVQPSIDLQTPSSVHVEDTVNVAGSLTTPDGPLAGQNLVVRVSTPSGWRDVDTVTTDPNGWFETTDTPSIAGSHCYLVSYAGDAQTSATNSQRCVSVTRWATNLTMSGPASAGLDDPVLLSGRLTTSEGDALGGVELTVSRTDKFQGAQTLPNVVTGADGSYVVRDIPPNGGDVTYAAAYAGSASRNRATATLNMPVSRPQPSLTLATDRKVYEHGQTSQLDVDLATDSSRTVQVYAQEVGRARTMIYSGDVPASGLTLQYPMTRNTTFTANVPEDGRALAASASLDRSTKAGLSTTALGSYRSSGSYKLYRPSADPRFAATMSPARDSACLTFQVQRHYASDWRTVKTSSCVPVADKSTATWKLTGTQATKTGYRVRPSFAGDDTNVAKTGAWVYFKFAKPS